MVGTVLCGSAWYLIWIFLWVFCVFCVGFMWVLFVLGPVWEDPVSESVLSRLKASSHPTPLSLPPLHFLLFTLH